MIRRIRNMILKYRNKCLPIFDQGVVSGGSFILGILLARELGLLLYGEYTLIWLVVLFCSSLHQAWLIYPMYTFAPQLKEEERKGYFDALLVHHLVFNSLASILSFGLITLAGHFFSDMKIEGIGIWVALTVFAYLMYDFFRRTYYAQESIQNALLLDVLVYGIQTLGILICIKLSLLDLKVTLMIVSCSYILSIYVGIQKLRRFRWEKEQFLKILKSHWNFSKWLLATALLQWVSGNFFIVAAAGILSPVVVGVIRILQNIIGVLHVLFLALENYVPIRASKILQIDGIDNLGVFLRQVTWKGGVVTFLIATLIALFGEEIIDLLYQGKYTEYANLLYGFAFLYLLVFIGTNYRFAIRTLKQTKSIFVAYLWSVAFSLIFAKSIVQSFGIEGVIAGLILSQLIMQAYFRNSIRTKLKLFWK
ncbi:MAG: hypothetical protein JKY48_01840 [Flavobacteriales bacterium]|nr:hypothetical protein [Flavobacteriales bacterium]